MDPITIAIVVALVFVVLMGFAWIMTLIRKVGPNEALIIYGLGTTTSRK